MKNPKFKVDEQEQANMAIKFLLKARYHAKTQHIRVTHALRELLNKYPDITRPVMAKSAAYAGISMRTACNVWDDVNHE